MIEKWREADIHSSALAVAIPDEDRAMRVALQVTRGVLRRAKVVCEVSDLIRDTPGLCRASLRSVCYDSGRCGVRVLVARGKVESIVRIMSVATFGLAMLEPGWASFDLFLCFDACDIVICCTPRPSPSTLLACCTLTDCRLLLALRGR